MKASLVSIAVVLMMGGLTYADDAPNLKGCKCPVSGKAAVADHHVDYKEGHVYFCCPNCPGAFEGNTAKFAAKANRQLVKTGQYEQTVCPFTGQPIKEHAKGNPKVGFCCKNCLGKYNAASDAEQLNLVFGDKPFEKGFEPAEKDE